MADIPEYTSTPFTFKLDGKAFQLKRLGFGDIETAAQAQGASDDPIVAIRLMSDLLATKADKRTLTAINSMEPLQLRDLFQRWAGLNPGESSTSGE